MLELVSIFDSLHEMNVSMTFVAHRKVKGGHKIGTY